MGKLVLGLNPRRPRDELYESFLGLVAGQVSASIANARAYEDERQRAEALAELDRAKTTFFSNVSHEFRTPLTLMLGPLEELLARDDAPHRDQLLVVQRNGQRLLKLVNMLLDFARIEAGRAQASYRHTDLAELTADLASNFRAACDRAGLRLDVSCAASARAWVDRDMWEKVVLNLVSNAFKFTLQGGITVRCGRRCAEGSPDGGRYRRGHSARCDWRACSSGSIASKARRVAATRAAASGWRWCTSSSSCTVARSRWRALSGAGTTFTVDIPKGHAHLPREQLNDPRDEAPASARADAYVAEALGWLADATAIESKPASTARRNGRVLVADDNADLRQYVQRLLAEQYEVEVVVDGVAALEAARARRPDVIVSDVMMPRLDGFGLIQRTARRIRR